jgi:hypothetical protein
VNNDSVKFKTAVKSNYQIISDVGDGSESRQISGLFFVPDQHRVIDHPGRAQVHQGGARLLSRHRQIAQSLKLKKKIFLIYIQNMFV